jgi:hypothetical protein
MKDKLGLYYYPNPLNKRVRTYVKEVSGQVFFRLWNADDTELWEDHGWVSYDAIRQASAMYTGDQFDPKEAYDIQLAQALLKEERDRN